MRADYPESVSGRVAVAVAAAGLALVGPAAAQSSTDLRITVWPDGNCKRPAKYSALSGPSARNCSPIETFTHEGAVIPRARTSC